LFIGGRPLDGERNPFDGQERKGGLRHKHLPTRPTLEGEATGEAAQGSPLGRDVGEANANHRGNLPPSTTGRKGQTGAAVGASAALATSDAVAYPAFYPNSGIEQQERTDNRNGGTVGDLGP